MKRIAIKKPVVDLFLDSGAYSSWSRQVPLSLDDYIAYCHKYKDYLSAYVNLDVIPGLPRQPRTQDQREASASMGYANLQIMKKAGLKPIPVFHQDEREYWLDRMLDDGEEYIGLSSGKDLQPSLKSDWLDRMFSKITDGQGRPLVKVHGFGITNTVLLKRFPFYTVDSTTWTMTPAYGQIIVPPLIGDTFDYTRRPVRVATSAINHSSVSSQKMQYEFMGPVQRRCVDQFLQECGTTIHEARYSPLARVKCVLRYYENLTEHLRGVRHEHRQEGLLNKSLVNAKPLTFDHVTIIFATLLGGKSWNTMLNALHIRPRLLSYFELRKRSDDVIKYVKTGLIESERKAIFRKARAEDDPYYRNQRRINLLQHLARPSEEP